MKKTFVFLTLLCVLLVSQGVFAVSYPTVMETQEYTGSALPFLSNAGKLDTEGYEFYFCVYAGEDEGICGTFDATKWIPGSNGAMTSIAGIKVDKYFVKYQSYNSSEKKTGQINGTLQAEITPKVVDIIWTDPESYEYSGEEIMPTAAAEGASIEVTVTLDADEEGAKAIDAGIYTAVASIDDANYKIGANETHEFEITPKVVDITWTDPESYEYSGEEIMPTAAVEGASIEVTVTLDADEEGAKAINAGKYTAVASIDDANYEIGENETHEFEITPKVVGITWTDPESYEYSGEEIMPTAAVEGASIEVTVTLDADEEGAKAINAGKYTAVASIDDANYEIGENETHEFEITPKVVGITWTDPESYEYSGEEIMPTAAVEGASIEVTVTLDADEEGAKAIDAGKYTAVASIDDANYKIGANETHDFEITQLEAKLAVDPEEYLEYNGAEQGPSILVTNAIDGDEFEIEFDGKQTNAGVYEATVTNLGNDNYKLPDPATVEFTINQVNVSTSENVSATLVIKQDDKVVAEEESPRVIYNGFEYVVAEATLTFTKADGTTEEIDAEIDENESDRLTQTEIGSYKVAIKADGEEGKDAYETNFYDTFVTRWIIFFEAPNTLDFYYIGLKHPGEPICRNCFLPATGFSSRVSTPLSVKPAGFDYTALNMSLQIPSISMEAEIAGVPQFEDTWAVEWLGNKVGLLSGSYLPGEGTAVIAAHNTLNNTEYGPFAMLASVAENDMIFVNQKSGMLRYTVYANQLVGPNDMAKVLDKADQVENSLVLVTCENESTEGGYLNRRVVFAKPF